MPLILTLELVAIVGVFLFLIYKTIKKKLISIKYSIIWIVSGALMLIAAISPNLLNILAEFMGFKLVSNMLFLIGFLILFCIAFSLTVIVSIQKREITTLVQELGILKSQIYSYDKEK